MLFFGLHNIAETKPKPKTILPQIGKASYYGNFYNGRKTSNAERYNPAEFTAAHESLPLGTTVKVTHKPSGKSVVVRINDRCACRRHGRIIDLSYAAATQLGILDKGVAVVTVSAL
jgi:rare lipoprotein A